MDKPRIFLGSSGKQARLLKSLTGGLATVAEVEPWTGVFNPGSSTLDTLVRLTREVDFAAFVFAQDDWTTPTPGDPGTAVPGQASPRDNVVFEAGLFGGALGMRRTFILHANGAKLPTDLLGLTCVRYEPELTPQELKSVNQKVRKAIEAEGRLARIEGDWWQYSLSARSEVEPSAVSLLRISRDRNRWPRGQRPLVAGGRHPLGALLERGDRRSCTTQPASSTSTGRAPASPGRAAARGHRRDQAGVRGPRRRRLDDPVDDRTRSLPSARRASTCAPRPPTGPSSSRATCEERRTLIAQRLLDWDGHANS